MTDIEDALNAHFPIEYAESVATILKLGAAYGDGDAIAGMKLSAVSSDEWDRLTELFADAGFDAEFTNRMSVVGFVQSPETHDGDLNDAIKNL